MLPISLLPCFQWFLRSLPRGSHRLIPVLERCFDLDEIVTTSLQNGQHARVHSRDVLQRLLFWLGAYERYTTELFLSLVKPGMTVLDIGANVGYFTLMAAERVGPDGRVVAFEPVFENLVLLKENVALNEWQNVTIEVSAVTDAESTHPLFLYRKGVNSGMASIVGTEGNPSIETRTVQSYSVDGYLRDNEIDRVHLIKMDVQGGEGKALDGMWQTISRDDGPILVWELNPSVLAQCRDSARRLLNRLDDKGYDTFLIGSRILTPVRPDAANNLADGSMLLSSRKACELPRGWSRIE